MSLGEMVLRATDCKYQKSHDRQEEDIQKKKMPNFFSLKGLLNKQKLFFTLRKLE